MKKRSLGIGLLLSGFALTLGAFLIPENKVDEGYSITYATTLPTTIKLKDNTESEIRQYYSGLNSLTTSQRQGTNLLKNLRDIIHDDITYYPYGSISSAGVTLIYTITDRDWTNSPASSIVGGSYNSSTKTISNYNHVTEKNSDPYITMLYVDYTRNGPTHFLNGTSASFDKEHVWSQSHGFKADSGATGPAGTDLHHLISGEKQVNQNYHSNYTYGNVKVASREAADGQASGTSPNFIISGNKTGTAVHSSAKDEETTVFEPCDADKGRIARALLYMVACYNNYSGNETISQFDPNLELVDYIVQSGSSVSSSASTSAKYGILSDLLEWNRTYKPTTFEIHRNNLIYNNYQFNRNPFIDFPEWADFIWGNKDSGYQSTGYAQPSTDTINDYNSGSDPISVTGVTLNKNSTSIQAGGSETLVATVSPSNATNKAISWTSGNTNIASVDSSGLVTGVAEGSTTITATTSDGGFTANCTVTVTSSGGGDTPEEDSYTWDLTTSSYSSASTTQVTWDSDFSTMVADKHNATTNANNYLPPSYSSSRFYSSSKLTVTPKSGYEITSVTYNAMSNNYANAMANSTWTNASASVSGSIVTITPTDGTQAFYAVVSGTSGASSVVLNYQSTSTVSLSSISLDTSNVKTEFAVNDTFDSNGLVVTAHYSDASTAIVTPTSVSTPNMSTAGEKTVTVTYTENNVSKSASYNINVSVNPSLSWNAPCINAYSGSSLTSSQADSWGVEYNNGSGSITYPTSSEFTVKLNGSAISLPYTWKPNDDGKTLSISYNSLTSTSSESVCITQTINPVYGPTTEIYDYTFESKQYSAMETKALGGHSWTASGTGDGYWGYDSTKGQQFGSEAKPYSSLSLTSTDFTNTITSVTVYTSGASSISASVVVSVGGTDYGSAKSITTSNVGYTFDLGGKKGNIVISWSQSSSKAIYIKEIVVRSSGTSDISNSEDHIDAQRAVVKFAKTFNTAMDSTNGCTTNMTSAWSTATSAWNTLLNELEAMDMTEETYALNLIKYATAQWTDDTDSDYSYCLERALATYEKCVNDHGQTAFMSTVRPVDKAPSSPIINITQSGNMIAIIVLVTIISVSAIGGYFYIRRFKEK